MTIDSSRLRFDEMSFVTSAVKYSMLPHSSGENGTVVERAASDNRCSHERMYSFTSLRSDMA
jgi:hypothetical protein